MTGIGPSEWALVFDCETSTDAAQSLRFGGYQVRKGGELIEAGLFYDPLSLSSDEVALLQDYAEAHRIYAVTVDQFVERMFFYFVYDLGALCIGFNLPFDLSRLTTGHASARGKTMRGGFSLQLTQHTGRPRVQIKHLNNRSALIQFTAPKRQSTPRSRRNRGMTVPAWRGCFVDVKTLACALLSGSWNLKSLADHLKTEHRKLETDEHGLTLSSQYLDYAMQDVQVTWECFEKLSRRYGQYGLTQTPVNRIYSEAGIGKAYLKEMGIKPFREQCPEFPPAYLGMILASYYGGRSEVHIRKQVTRVLYCDFLSMYPTVCTLQNLWRFVIAEGVAYHEVTAETQEFLDQVTLEDLQNPETWRKLAVLVYLEPDEDILPVRAKYSLSQGVVTGNDRQYAIGLNYLSYGHGMPCPLQPLPYTLADCIASKLLTGKSPKVVRAFGFEPQGVQPKLKPIDIMGNPNYHINPSPSNIHGDDGDDPRSQSPLSRGGACFYRSLIDLRNEVKEKLLYATDDQKDQLNAEQQSLKITANATSYGIFVELNVTQYDQLQNVTVYGNEIGTMSSEATGVACLSAVEPFTARLSNIEEPGSYFHPLLATLITGAARLMLAVTERLVTPKDREGGCGLDWVFCDTDSMAIAPRQTSPGVTPERMDDGEFYERSIRVQEWFAPLNPYRKVVTPGEVCPGSLLEAEKENWSPPNIRGDDVGSSPPGGSGRGLKPEPLYCYAVSAKRYALFNRDHYGRPVIRKASAHGLGYLLPPYEEKDAPRFILAPKSLPSMTVQREPLLEIGLERWEYDLWYVILRTALGGEHNRVMLQKLPGLDRPAVSRYLAANPNLLSWFKRYNRNIPYREQVKPFNFLLAFQGVPFHQTEAGRYGRLACPSRFEAGVEPGSSPPRKSGGGEYPRVAAPYDTDLERAAENCFDRNTGKPVPLNQLKSYRQALAQYHMHPEAKFRNADYMDRGVTQRRHILVEKPALGWPRGGVEYIGKEANGMKDGA